MSYDNNVFDNPEKHGLTVVATIEAENLSYEFDIIAVWKHTETGKLYWAYDSGCSCPLPFENFTTISSLTPLKNISVLQERLLSDGDYITRSLANRNDFLRTVREAMKK